MVPLPELAVTPGEPAGIGPDLILTLAQQPRSAHWRVIADPGLLKERAARLGLRCTLSDLPTREAGHLWVDPISLAAPVEPGRLDAANAAYVLATLQRASTLCLAGTSAALVTGPVQKSVLNDAGIPFTGHTEFFRDSAGVPDVVMLLVADALRVALATTHLPLSAVPAAITTALLERRLRILIDGLGRWFRCTAPRVLVAGLNPHAGEGGHLGREEIEVIAPLCERLRAAGHHVTGPLPADTLFLPRLLADADAALAMYHDQGLPVLKHAGFGKAVNVTLGLPYLRTSVDHGTALDLAATGQADSGSFAAALDLATESVLRAGP
ncbi:MAG: 4-hydroxythreonine-4-phosphate dehydrogenase PdxA [Pseudomonadota bacterium]